MMQSLASLLVCLLAVSQLQAFVSAADSADLYPKKSLEACQKDNEALNGWLWKHEDDNYGWNELEKSIEKLTKLHLGDKQIKSAALALKELAETDRCTPRTWDLIEHFRATTGLDQQVLVASKVRKAAQQACKRSSAACEPAVRQVLASSYASVKHVDQLEGAIWNSKMLNMKKKQPFPAEVDGSAVILSLAGEGWSFKVDMEQLQSILHDVFKQDSRYAQLAASSPPVDATLFDELYQKLVVKPCTELFTSTKDVREKIKLLIAVQTNNNLEREQFWKQQPAETRRQMFVTEVCRRLPPTFAKAQSDFGQLLASYPWKSAA